MMNQPNILLINCDDLGYGDLSCYGSPVNKTPHIDKLAEEGLRLTDFYMASPVCTPSRGAMMTGCYPPRIGFDDFDGRPVLFPGQPHGLHEDEKTIGHLLQEAGYRTKLVGKWHCGDQREHLPCERGFDEYYGLPYSNDMGRQKHREDGPPLPLIRDRDIIQEQPDQRGLTERYTEECVRFIRENTDRPFFLYLAHMYVHVPLFVPDRFLRASENGAYGGAVECIDWTMSVLVDELKQQGLDENTIIIFTSDNGSRARDEGGSNHPLRGTKFTTWEGGQRVPCIIRWPASIAPGRESDHILSAIDLLPTLVKIAGGTVPVDRRIDGVDFSALLAGDKSTPARNTFCYYFQKNLEAIRHGDWKLHFGTDGDWRQSSSSEPGLYNLKEDVGEQNNLVDQYPEIVADLSRLADAVRADTGDTLQGIEGAGNRPVGLVSEPVPLTTYDENHPYMISMYDMADSPKMAG